MAKAMANTRVVLSGRRRYTIKLFDDGAIGIYDGKEVLIAGWPETALLNNAWLQTKTDEEWCDLLAKLRRLR